MCIWVRAQPRRRALALDNFCDILPYHADHLSAPFVPLPSHHVDPELCRYLPLAVTALAEMNRRADIYLSSSLTPRMRELSGAIMALAAGNDLRGDRVLEVRTGHAGSGRGGMCPSDLPQSRDALISMLHSPLALLPTISPLSLSSPAAISPMRSLPCATSQQHVLTLGHHLAASAALLTELARLSTGVGSALRGDAAPLVYSRPAVLQPDGECLCDHDCALGGDSQPVRITLFPALSDLLLAAPLM